MNTTKNYCPPLFLFFILVLLAIVILINFIILIHVLSQGVFALMPTLDDILGCLFFYPPPLGLLLLFLLLPFWLWKYSFRVKFLGMTVGMIAGGIFLERGFYLFDSLMHPQTPTSLQGGGLQLGSVGLGIGLGLVLFDLLWFGKEKDVEA